MSARGPVVCVVGPTASGKSALADLVAERLGSSVVSVDAMQVYRGMDVGTAKTPPGERRVPLLMVDVADPLEDYSVRLFQREARACVDALLDEGCVPVLCGGTGLYLNAVIDEMEFPAGEKGCEARGRYERLAAEQGADALHALLAERDADAYVPGIVNLIEGGYATREGAIALSAEEKNAISHRGRAVRRLAEYLQNRK